MANIGILLSLTIFALLRGSLAFPNGAPVTACDSLTPQPPHNNTGTMGPFPYNLSIAGLENTTYSPGQSYTGIEWIDFVMNIARDYIICNFAVTLSATGGQLFRGFLIQIRSVANGNILSGINPVGLLPNVRLHSCSPSDGGVTHTSNSTKSSISFQWIPTSGMGSVIFRLLSSFVQLSIYRLSSYI